MKFSSPVKVSELPTGAPSRSATGVIFHDAGRKTRNHANSKETFSIPMERPASHFEATEMSRKKKGPGRNGGNQHRKGQTLTRVPSSKFDGRQCTDCGTVIIDRDALCYECHRARFEIEI